MAKGEESSDLTADVNPESARTGAPGGPWARAGLAANTADEAYSGCRDTPEIRRVKIASRSGITLVIEAIPAYSRAIQQCESVATGADDARHLLKTAQQSLGLRDTIDSHLES